MNKAKNHCMKRLSLQMIRILTGTVHFITQKWMTDTCHMHTNLMRSACFQTAFHISGIFETFQNFIMCDSILAVFIVDSHLFAVNRMAPDGTFDRPFVFFQYSCYDCPVSAPDRMLF